MIRIPQYQKVHFRLNRDSGYFMLTSAPPGFTAMPDELRHEETQDRKNIQADHVLRGRVRNGKYIFFTGLRPTPSPRMFTGNKLEKNRKRSLILFRFSEKGDELTAFYFPFFLPAGKLLTDIVREFLFRK